MSQVWRSPQSLFRPDVEEREACLVVQLCIEASCVGLAMRPIAGDWQYLQISASDSGSFDDSSFKALTVSDYLAFKERLVGMFLLSPSPFTHARP